MSSRIGWPICVWPDYISSVENRQSVILAQGVQRQGRRQPTGALYLNTVGKDGDPHLHVSAVVVTMGYGISDTLGMAG